MFRGVATKELFTTAKKKRKVSSVFLHGEVGRLVLLGLLLLGGGSLLAGDQKHNQSDDEDGSHHASNNDGGDGTLGQVVVRVVGLHTHGGVCRGCLGQGVSSLACDGNAGARCNLNALGHRGGRHTGVGGAQGDGGGGAGASHGSSDKRSVGGSGDLIRKGGNVSELDVSAHNGVDGTAREHSGEGHSVGTGRTGLRHSGRDGVGKRIRCEEGVARVVERHDEAGARGVVSAGGSDAEVGGVGRLRALTGTSGAGGGKVGVLAAVSIVTAGGDVVGHDSLHEGSEQGDASNRHDEGWRLDEGELKNLLCVCGWGGEQTRQLQKNPPHFVHS